MKHIDKKKHEHQALQLIDSFMRPRWVDANKAFTNISYDDLRDKQPGTALSYRQSLEDIICENQDGYCCYCMRRLGENDMKTLEHLIPDGLDGKTTPVEDVQKYNEYVDYNLPFLTRHNVELAFVFKQNGRISAPPYPHDISYHNLVLSCDGKYPTGSKSRSSKTCNHHRQQNDLCPVFYDMALSAAVEYEPSGEILARPTEPDDVKEKIASIALATALSYDALRAIRHLWYIVRHYPMADLEAVASSGEDVDVSSFVGSVVTGQEKEDEDVRSFFNNVQMWHTFLQYCWFKDYYSQRYP